MRGVEEPQIAPDEADRFDCCWGQVRLTGNNGKEIDLAKKVL